MSETRTYRGYFRRIGADGLRFQPCGAKAPLELIGSPLARYVLKDRIRWTAPFEGAKLYGVFQGAIVSDSVGASGDDTTNIVPQTRFFLVEVDSLREWRSSDCDGMPVS